ncbi:hypothetical protein B0H13DRAFT_2069575, partial [Mycena leptocephala]
MPLVTYSRHADAFLNFFCAFSDSGFDRAFDTRDALPRQMHSQYPDGLILTPTVTVSMLHTVPHTPPLPQRRTPAPHVPSPAVCGAPQHHPARRALFPRRAPILRVCGRCAMCCGRHRSKTAAVPSHRTLPSRIRRARVGVRLPHELVPHAHRVSFAPVARRWMLTLPATAPLPRTITF